MGVFIPLGCSVIITTIIEVDPIGYDSSHCTLIYKCADYVDKFAATQTVRQLDPRVGMMRNSRT